MSLIDEALKRARLDAARQDAARQTLAEAPRSGGFASPWGHMPERRRSVTNSRQVVLGAVAVLSLVVGAVGITLYLRGGRASEAANVAAPANPQSASAAAAAPPVLGTSAAAPLPPAPPSRRTVNEDRVSEVPRNLPTRQAVADDDRREDGRRPKSGPAKSAPEATVASAAQGAATGPEAAPAPAPAVASPLAAGGAPPNAAPAAAASSASRGSSAAVAVDGGSYVGEVKLPGGFAVKLSGIAFSEQSPVAVINGKVLAPGQGTEQVTVDKIEADRVTLRDRSGILFFLRLN